MTDAANEGGLWALHNPDMLRRNILKYTVPFAGFQDAEPKHQGSGVLFKIADAHFVLTASHVVEPAKNKYKIPIFIGAGSNDTPGISLVGLRIMVLDDPHDLAVIELRPDDAKEVAKTHRFLNLAQCDFSPSYHPGQPFLLVGFPHVQSQFDPEKKILSVEPFAHVTWLYHVDRQGIPGTIYQEALHLLFDYSDSLMDNQGNPLPLPAPQGISGCGIWRIARQGGAPDVWSPEDFNLDRQSSIE